MKKWTREDTEKLRYFCFMWDSDDTMGFYRRSSSGMEKIYNEHFDSEDNLTDLIERASILFKEYLKD